jgi:hypothetical protein
MTTRNFFSAAIAISIMAVPTFAAAGEQMRAAPAAIPGMAGLALRSPFNFPSSNFRGAIQVQPPVQTPAQNAQQSNATVNSVPAPSQAKFQVPGKTADSGSYSVLLEGGTKITVTRVNGGNIVSRTDNLSYCSSCTIRGFVPDTPKSTSDFNSPQELREYKREYFTLKSSLDKAAAIKARRDNIE